ncbi:uncharacterized protein LOC143368842 [Andrena cerasifolii]|uniref:uncharacterized protein LOC143368842 n=1 Tax=Andrena cerasifolii TaxID=2819439 RepID=UPI0040376003
MRSPTKKFSVGTSKHDLWAKPYGFCCDIKDHDPTLRLLRQDSEPLFPYCVTGGGPDIRFRIQDADAASPSAARSQRSAQRSGYRSAQRSGHRSGHQSGYEGRRRSGHQSGHESGRRGGYRGRQQGVHDSRRRRNRRDDGFDQEQSQGIYRNVNPRSDVGKGVTIKESLDEPMICRRCRGPLRWYLEDEIAAARDEMMSRKQQEYNTELDMNVKIAMKKERMKRRKREKLATQPRKPSVQSN